jgi:HK97 family phage major capsid protein
MDRVSREARERIENEMQQIIARCDREGKRGLNIDERARWDRLADSHSVLENRIAKNEGGSRPGIGGRIGEVGGLEEIRDSYRLTPAAFRERRGADPRAKAFSNWLRGGMDRLEPDEKELMRQSFIAGGFQNAQSTTTGSQGGFVVPQGFSQMIEVSKKWYGGVDKNTVSYFRTESGNPWPYPTVSDQVNQGRIISQNAQVVETDFFESPAVQ